MGNTDTIDFEIIELLFFAYRDFVSDPDAILRKSGFGRAHHRVVHFVNREPGMTVADLLDTLKITKQSLARVLKQLIDSGYIRQVAGPEDRRQRKLYPTKAGRELALALAEPQSRRIEKRIRRCLSRGARRREEVSERHAGQIQKRDGLNDDEDSDFGRCGPSARGRRRHAHSRAAQSLPDGEGFRVTVAADGAEARRKLEGLDFDLIIMDVMMPGESGIALTEGAARHQERPDHHADGAGGGGQRIAGLEAGADDYLSKPFDPRELVLRINNILRRNTPARRAEDRAGHVRPLHLLAHRARN